MNILIVCQHFYPEQFQINDIAPALVQRGHNVTVLTGLPNYPKGDVFDGYDDPSNRKRLDEKYEEQYGVHIIRCSMRPRKKGVKNLMLNYVSFAYNARKVVAKLNGDYDIVLSYQLSPITMSIPAIVYKNRWKRPLLLYCLDLWPESAKAHIKKPFGLLYKFICLLSRNIYNKCDRILVTSRPFIEYLNKNNRVPLSKLAYLPQHADSSMISMDLTAEDNGVADFMFAGNLGAGQNLTTIVEAAAILGSRPDYKIHFVGDGSQRELLEKMIKDYNLQKNIVVHGNQKRENMPSFYKMADALLITLRGNNFVGNTMPGKMQMYMTTGKPILGAINGAANEVISESGCGKSVASGDYKGLAELMREYIETPGRYAQCGEKARDYFMKHFTQEIFIDKLENELMSLLKTDI